MVILPWQFFWEGRGENSTDKGAENQKSNSCAENNFNKAWGKSLCYFKTSQTHKYVMFQTLLPLPVK